MRTAGTCGIRWTDLREEKRPGKCTSGRMPPLQGVPSTTLSASVKIHWKSHLEGRKGVEGARTRAGASPTSTNIKHNSVLLRKNFRVPDVRKGICTQRRGKKGKPIHRMKKKDAQKTIPRHGGSPSVSQVKRQEKRNPCRWSLGLARKREG